MQEKAMEMNGDQKAESLDNVKITLMHREGSTWNPSDIEKIENGIKKKDIRLIFNKEYSDYLIILGDWYTHREILEFLGGSVSFSRNTLCRGLDDQEIIKLPFKLDPATTKNPSLR
jgi:hypothetical protein